MGSGQHGSLFDEQHFQQAQTRSAPAPEQEPSSDGEPANIELHGMFFEDISVSGMTPMDLSVVAKMVNDKVKELEKECFEGPGKGGIDTLRLALLTAFNFASELYILQQESGLTGKAHAKRIDAIVDQLQQTLRSGRE